LKSIKKLAEFSGITRGKSLISEAENERGESDYSKIPGRTISITTAPCSSVILPSHRWTKFPLGEWEREPSSNSKGAPKTFLNLGRGIKRLTIQVKKKEMDRKKGEEG